MGDHWLLRADLRLFEQGHKSVGWLSVVGGRLHNSVKRETTILSNKPARNYTDFDTAGHCYLATVESLVSPHLSNLLMCDFSVSVLDVSKLPKAQTELGHGSNVRALETTATFVAETPLVFVWHQSVRPFLVLTHPFELARFVKMDCSQGLAQKCCLSRQLVFNLATACRAQG